MNNWEKKRILVLVKTYPNPSTKYQEVVCTAGITSEGQLIRIYPVRYRYLEDKQKFEKFRWVEADVIRNTSDTRPESYKINYDTIRLLNMLDSQKHFQERVKIVDPLISDSMEHIRQKWKEENVSLGIFEPLSVSNLIVKKTDNPEWTDEEWALLNQLSCEDNNTDMQRKRPLEKIPYEFYFRFKCNNPECKGHNSKITDWELYQAYRKYSRDYGEEKGIEALKANYRKMFDNPKRRTLFITGTTHQQHRYGTFILIGVISIHKLDHEQLSLY